MGPLQPQQGERHPDVVVEAGFAPERRLFLTQDRCDQFLGGRFAVGASDGDHGQVKIAPVGRSQPAQRAPGVIDPDHGASLQRRRRLAAFGHNGGNAAAGDFGQETVAVKTLAAEREKEVPRFGQAGVGGHAGHRLFGRAAEKVSIHRISDIFKRARFHEYRLNGRVRPSGGRPFPLQLFLPYRPLEPPPPSAVNVWLTGGSRSMSGFRFK